MGWPEESRLEPCPNNQMSNWVCPFDRKIFRSNMGAAHSPPISPKPTYNPNYFIRANLLPPTAASPLSLTSPTSLPTSSSGSSRTTSAQATPPSSSTSVPPPSSTMPIVDPSTSPLPRRPRSKSHNRSSSMISMPSPQPRPKISALGQLAEPLQDPHRQVS